MIERDTLMRQTQQLAQALAQIFRLRTEQDDRAVLEAIDEASEKHLGGSAQELRMLAPSMLVDLCSEGSRFSSDAAHTLAHLLVAQGDAHRNLDAPDRAGACYARALLLLRYVLNTPEAPVSWKIGTELAALEQHLDALPVSDAMQKALGDTPLRTDTA
jgi:aminoglycoside phosphotransferase